MKRNLLILVIVVMLVAGVWHDASRIAGWIKAMRTGESERDLFFRHCASMIPETAPVLLVTGDTPWMPASKLYPRPLRVVTWEQARTAPEPDAWVVSYEVPFDPKTSFVGRARDLR